MSTYGAAPRAALTAVLLTLALGACSSDGVAEQAAGTEPVPAAGSAAPSPGASGGAPSAAASSDPAGAAPAPSTPAGLAPSAMPSPVPLPSALPTALPSPPAPAGTYRPAALDISPGPQALLSLDWESPQPLRLQQWALQSCPAVAGACASGPDGAKGTVRVVRTPVAALPAAVGTARGGGDAAALRAVADSFVAAERRSPSIACGPSARVTPTRTEVFAARDGQVVRYGYSVQVGSQVVGRVLRYATLSGSTLVALQAQAADAGVCRGAVEGAFTPAGLGGFAPVLDGLVRVTPLPR